MKSNPRLLQIFVVLKKLPQFLFTSIVISILPLPGIGEAEADIQISGILEKITGPEEFTVERPENPDGAVVSVLDFGAAPDRSAEVNLRAFRSAISHARQTNAARLLIPEGRYYLRVEEAVQLSFAGFSDFILDGNGSTLVFKDHDNYRRGAYIRIEDSKRFKVRDLALDWDWENSPLAAIGEVVAVDEGESTVDFLIHDLDVPDTAVITGGREWDPEIKNRSPRGYSLPGSIAIRETLPTSVLDSNLIRVSVNQPAVIGQHTNLNFHVNFLADAFVFENNDHLIFENVTVHSAPYMAFWGRLNQYLQISGCTVAPPPDSKRVKSVHSVFEIHACRGYFILEDSFVSDSPDDIMHYKDSFVGAGLVAADDPYQVIGDFLQHWQTAPVLRPGDEFELLDRDFAPIGWRSTLKNVEWQMNYHVGERAPNRVILTFGDKLPAEVPTDGVLINLTLNKGQYIIRNNTFRNGMCHGLFVCQPNGIIENNTIENMAYPSLMVHMLVRWERWASGVNPRNVIIRGNRIRQSNTALREPATLFVGAGYDPRREEYQPVNYPVTRNILVEDNVIEGSATAALGAWSVKNVIFRNNIIRDAGMSPLPEQSQYRGMGNVFLSHAENVVFAGNRLEANEESHEVGVFVDASTTRRVSLRDNAGFGAVRTERPRVERVASKTVAGYRVYASSDVGRAAQVMDGNSHDWVNSRVTLDNRYAPYAPQWIGIDLGSERKVAAVTLHMGRGDGSAMSFSEVPENYRLQYLLNDEWTDLPGGVISGNHYEVNRVVLDEPLNLRRLMYVSADQILHRIREIEIHFDGDPVPEWDRPKNRRPPSGPDRRNMTVYASSDSERAHQVVDGVTSNWVASRVGLDNRYPPFSPQWIGIDFGGVFSLSGLRLHFGRGDGSSDSLKEVPRNYRLQYQDESGRWVDIRGSLSTDGTRETHTVQLDESILTGQIRFVSEDRILIRVREIEFLN